MPDHKKTDWQARNIIITIQEKSYSRSKKKISTSKILKYLVDALCSTWTIRRHLNNEKIKHKKRIHHPTFTMKYKDKRLEYVCQDKTMSAKEWRKVVFSNGKKSSGNNPDGFKKCIVEEDMLWSVRGGASHLLENLNNSLSGVDKKQEIMWRC